MIHYRELYDRFETVKAVYSFTEKYAVFEKGEGFKSVEALLLKRIDKIKKLGVTPPPSSIADSKATLRKMLAEETSRVAKLLFAYASVTGNPVLKNAIHYTYSDIYRSKENTMLGRCRQVLNAARKIKNREHYFINDSVIERLEERLEKYRDYMHNPVAGRRNHARNNILISKLLKECFDIIEIQIDPIVFMVVRDIPSAYSDFKSKCKVYSTPGRRRKYVKKAKDNTTLSVLNTQEISNITFTAFKAIRKNESVLN